MTVALETIGLNKSFGGIVATNDVSLKIEAGARHALIGPNGAGKTTFVNQLTGVFAPTSGRVILAGEELEAQCTYSVRAKTPKPQRRSESVVRLLNHVISKALRALKCELFSGRQRDLFLEQLVAGECSAGYQYDGKRSFHGVMV